MKIHQYTNIYECTVCSTTILSFHGDEQRYWKSEGGIGIRRKFYTGLTQDKGKSIHYVIFINSHNIFWADCTFRKRTNVICAEFSRIFSQITKGFFHWLRYKNSPILCFLTSLLHSYHKIWSISNSWRRWYYYLVNDQRYGKSKCRNGK